MAGGGDSSDPDSSSVSTVLSEWLIVVLIVASTVFEFSLHRIEHWITHKHNHLQAVVRTLFRELMVLGLVSFSFILYELIVHPTTRVVLSFEFAHLFIFLFAVSYTIFIMSAMFTSLRLSARWKRMEHIDLVRYLHLKDQYSRMRHRLHTHHSPSWRLVRWWFPNIILPWRYWQLHEIMAFHDIRFQFIFYRNLPDHFRFSSFLRKIKSATFVELVESHWSLYTIFLLLVLADIGRRELTNPPEDLVFETSFYIAAAISLAVFVQILDLKIRRIYWHLTKHPRVYYEGVEPDHVAEELAAARRAQRQRSHSRSSDQPVDLDPDALADDEATDPSAPLPPPSTPIAAIAQQHKLDPNRGAEAPPPDKSVDTDLVVAANLPVPDAAPDAAPDRLLHARHSLDQGPHSRHSLDQGPHSRHSLDQGPHSRHSLDHTPHSRHSLDIARPPSVARPTTRGGELAQAAVEAARRRSLEAPAHSPSPVPPASPHARHSLDGAAQRTSLTEYPSLPRLARDTRKSSDTNARRSIELVAAMPRDELAKRNHWTQTRQFAADTRINLDSDLDDPAARASVSSASSSVDKRSAHIRFSVDHPPRENGIDNGDVAAKPAADTPAPGADDAVTAPQPQQPFLKRHRSLAFLNATILKNLEQQENAKNMTPTEYPWIVTKLIPRLGRVASPVEKLFWFGSHKFFLWCVEFTLFFSTILQAAASATLGLELIENEPLTGLVIASFVLAVLSLLFVLVRIAGVIKRYIFILHNASLVSEEVALKAIYDVSKKPPMRYSADFSDISGSEDEKEEEEESARERRSRLGRFFKSEAESGNVPGIELSDAQRSASTSADPARRMRLRKLALNRRNRRVSESSSQIPHVPAHDTVIITSD